MTTEAGRRYTFSFQHSPGAGVRDGQQQVHRLLERHVLGTISRNGKGVTGTAWQTTTFSVTGTGTDRISFREADTDSVGALIDDVRLVVAS